MNRTLVAIPLALATAVLAPNPQVAGTQDPDPEVQDPPEEEEEEVEEEVHRDIFGRTRMRRSENGGLTGMWQLLAMDLEGYPEEGLLTAGYMLIGRGFLSLEMHAIYEDGRVRDEQIEDGFQTFMAEYELISGDRMVCRTLIGSFLDEEDDYLDFELVGETREYTVERDGEFLTLRWGEDDWMTFARRLPSSGTLEDIFGKEGGEPSKAGPDIFGRGGVKRPDKDGGD